MHGKATIFLGLMLALAATPASNAGHPNTNCNSTEGIHGYSFPGGAIVSVAGGGTSIGHTIVFDNCAADPVNGDGEYELGIGSAAFPAGTSPCVTNAHHGYGHGAQYWADETFGFNVAYSAGADGPALLQDPTAPIPCGTDGIVSDDPVTDPLDCGAGELGLYAPGITWTPATLGETVPGNGACNPFDGYVCLIAYAGVVVDLDTGFAILSTPTDGHMWG